MSAVDGALRKAILAAASNEQVERLAGRYGMQLGASRFVAGATLDECVAVLRRLNAQGFKANTTLLGESVADERAARAVVTEYERILERIRAALDPGDWMLMGPSYATPIALDKAGVTLKDIDVVDMHEAFAAQILCNVNAFKSKQFAKEKLGRSKAIGEVQDEKFNVHGGSTAIGHPFAATGARMVTTMANELALTGKSTALLGICAAGGLGAAAILER